MIRNRTLVGTDEAGSSVRATAAHPGYAATHLQLLRPGEVVDGRYRVEAYLGERKIKFQGPQPRGVLLRVKDRLGGFSGGWLQGRCG